MSVIQKLVINITDMVYSQNFTKGQFIDFFCFVLENKKRKKWRKKTFNPKLPEHKNKSTKKKSNKLRMIKTTLLFY